MKNNGSSDAPIRSALPLMGIDDQSGRLRLALAVAFFLFSWSFLAILDYYFNPLPDIPSLTDYWLILPVDAGFLQSMLGHYFSVFSILNMAILTTFWLLGFQSARAIITNALQISNPRFAGRFLRKRAFSNQTPCEIDATVESFKASDAGKVISQLGGPCLIRLKDGYGALIQNRKNEFRFLQGAAGGDQVWIDHQEKLISILPTRQSEFKLCFTAICGDGTRLSIKDMRITATNPMAEITVDFSDKQPVEIPIQNLDGFERHVLANWDGFARDSMQSEIKSFFLRSNKAIIKKIFSSKSGNLSNTRYASGKQKFHSEKHFPVNHSLKSFFMRRNRAGYFSRNRRRSIMPELRSASPNIKEFDSQSADFQVELQKFLTQKCKRIYNNAIINPRIISPGEITVE